MTSLKEAGVEQGVWMDHIDARLDRIERRLDLTEAPPGR